MNKLKRFWIGVACKEHVDIKPLVPLLPFIKNKNSWGQAFRYGFLEIDQESFEIFVKGVLGFNPLLE